MQQWLPYSFVALGSFGAANFIFKVAAHRGATTLDLVLSLNAMAALLSGLFALGSPDASGDLQLLLLLSVVGGCLHFANIFCRVESLKHVDTTVSLPIVRMDIVLAVCFSLIWLDESLSSWQLAGVFVGILVVFLAAGEGKKTQERKGIPIYGVLFAFNSAISSAASLILCRYAASLFDFYAFLTLFFAVPAVLAAVLKSQGQILIQNFLRVRPCSE